VRGPARAATRRYAGADHHFRSENRLLAFIDRRLEPLTRYWGWHTLSRTEVFDGLPLAIEKSYKMSRWSLFRIVIAKNGKEEVETSARRRWAEEILDAVAGVSRNESAGWPRRVMAAFLAPLACH